MRKSLIFVAAASALMLTACSREGDVLQSAAQPQQTAVQNRAVGFDIYTPAATNVTRAGLEGTMMTTRMQRSEADGGGFGVYAFLTEDTNTSAGTDESTANATSYSSTAPNVPNFMSNEKVLWNSTNLGWYYNPLKYWPNETDKDSQNTPASMEGTTPVHLDRLTFFAYAPYVAADDASGTGIIRITDKNGVLNTATPLDTPDPTIEWKATTSDADFNPDQGVDLLWGVAPAGGLSYTAVNGWTVTRNEGTPLLNMIKPDVNTSMKFLFQHALARFGINVVAAVDQVSPGGELDPNTKITINSFTISGPFGTTGQLNLNNGTHGGIANWTNINGTTVKDGTKITASGSEITLIGTAADDAIAPNLRFAGSHESPEAQTVVGVTTAKQDLIRPSTIWYNKLAGVPTYDPGKKYYSSDAGAAASDAKYTYTTPTEKNGVWGFLYTESAGVYTKQGSDITAPTYPTYPDATPTLYFVKATEHSVTVADTKPTTIADGANVYEIDNAANNGTESGKAPTFTHNATLTAGTFTGKGVGAKVYTLEAVVATPSEIFTYPAGTYYGAERNYLYVVPTNNFIPVNTTTPLNDDDKLALRTITVQIEYYITTKDEKLNAGFAQTKNVITKTVVLPSLSNGKTYMLNVVLGLTSVKIEAEVDDWKVVNSQADLPQNTAE